VRALAPLFVSFGLALLVTPLVRAAAARAGLLDPPCESRKVHTRPVPRLGGLAIGAAFYGALAATLCWGRLGPCLMPQYAGRVCGLAVAGLVIMALGAIDDVQGLGPATKLAVDLAVGCLLFAAGFRLQALAHPFGGALSLGWLSLPATALWVAGVANAVNLVDGLDGLAGGVGVAGAVAAFAIGAHAGDPLMLLGALAILGSVLGFMLYNVEPASIFMGDSGSLFVGTVLAALALSPRPGPSGSACVAGMAVVLGVPIVDTFLAIVRRAVRGVPVFSPDREHLHHRLLDAGMSHRSVVLVLWTASALLSVAGVLVARSGGHYARLTVLLIAAGAVALGRLGYFAIPDLSLVRRRRHNRARLRSADHVAERIERAASVTDVARELSGAAPLLDVGAVRLCPRVGPGAPSRPGEARPTFPRGAAFYVDPRRPERGALEVLWAGERRGLDRCTELAVERLCASVAVALSRLSRDRADARPHAGRPRAAWPADLGATRGGDAQERAPP
jgi:UDP-GlcNAc:undecaprenyl-phosphate GlcNAc-1-phosphate transferase